MEKIIYFRRWIFWVLLTFHTVGLYSKPLKGGRVIPYQPESQSQILSAKTIFSFKVESSKFQGEGDEKADGRNPWLLTGKILKIYKGALKEQSDSTFESVVSVYIGPMLSHPGGIWLNEGPKADDQWLIFCGPNSNSLLAGELLKDLAPDCSLFKAAEFETDLQLVAKITSENLNFDQALRLSHSNIKKINYLFIPFLVNRYSSKLIKDFDAFDQLLNLLELSTLTPMTRYTLRHELDVLIFSQADQPALKTFVHRMVVSDFRVVAMKGDDALNLLSVVIPTWLGLKSGIKKVSAFDVFKRYPKDKSETEKMLKKSEYTREAKELLKWMQASGK